MTPDEFRTWLAAGPLPVILDGGMAAVLEAAGHTFPDNDMLWTSRLLIDDPPALKQATSDFCKAGADMVCTATYQASQPAFTASSHVCDDDAATLMRSAVALARRAVDASLLETNRPSALPKSSPQSPQHLPLLSPHHLVGRRRPLVTLSLGPYAAVLGGGAEYRGYDLSPDNIRNLEFYHRRRAHIFFPSKVNPCGITVPDIVAFETLPASAEAVFVTKLMTADDSSTASLAHPPFYISFQVRSVQHLANGELLSDAVRLVLEAANGHPRLVALGVNCCNPRFVPELVATLRQEIEAFKLRASSKQQLHMPPIATIAYPNSGEDWQDSSGWTWPAEHGPLAPEKWADMLDDSAADIVGGCCRCGLAHIAALNNRRCGSLCQK